MPFDKKTVTTMILVICFHFVFKLYDGDG